jgi:hypothetical protein
MDTADLLAIPSALISKPESNFIDSLFAESDERNFCSLPSPSTKFKHVFQHSRVEWTDELTDSDGACSKALGGWFIVNSKEDPGTFCVFLIVMQQ